EFNIPQGSFRLEKVEGEGNGVEVKDGVVKFWGEEPICYSTIVQLTRQRPGSLPKVRVEERFDFSFRGFHLDIARGGVPKVETFKRILRLLFLLKYNFFAIYFEDLFPWKKYPRIGAYRGRLSEAELREVVEYGKKLGVEVFPSLELTGHMEHILSLPEFYRFNEWHNPSEGCLNVSDAEARDFCYELLKEVVDFFDSKYIHVGGDETWALGRGVSLNKSWSFEGPKLYEEHTRKLVEIVRASDKTPMLWGDMLTGMYLSEEERAVWRNLVFSNMWDRVIIANWYYSPSDKGYFKEKIRLFGERKGNQVACPALANWNKYYPNFEVALENTKNFIEAAKEEKLQGFLLTAWGDDGEECLFSFLDPLILATMEFAEGSGNWEEKWLLVNGEPNEVLEARKVFGKADLSEKLKHVLLADFWYYSMNESERAFLKDSWKDVLFKLRNTLLPEDLDFVRRCLELCVKRLEGTASASDFIAIANLYSKLWLSERKPEGLGRIIERLWGAAGRIDSKIR
ncbi:MAG: beta-N-acetylhexosaminidase, partial [Candidatus Bathyarchaeia archaeon]